MDRPLRIVSSKLSCFSRCCVSCELADKPTHSLVRICARLLRGAFITSLQVRYHDIGAWLSVGFL